jgi:hypothetical protein
LPDITLFLFYLPGLNNKIINKKPSLSLPFHEEIKLGKEIKSEQNETDESVLVVRRPMMYLEGSDTVSY